MRTLSHRPWLAILGFHKIGQPPTGGWKTWFYISEARFARQLRFLKNHGWQVIGLAAFLRGLAEPDTLPKKAALLTFDDGYRSMRRVALPLLHKFRYPAVLFMPTAFIGKRNSFDLLSEPEEEMCDWEDLRELERWGISVQSHGVSHRSLSELSAAEQREELFRSKKALEDGLGRPVEVFSYPYGDGGKDPQKRLALRKILEKAGYGAACMYGGYARRLPVTNPYRLPRLAMGPDTSLLAELECKATKRAS
jgi:peptidoglycan/xylan/chitin deacetylase (PgdA/CDA1 family)